MQLYQEKKMNNHWENGDWMENETDTPEEDEELNYAVEKSDE